MISGALEDPLAADLIVQNQAGLTPIVFRTGSIPFFNLERTT